MVVGLLRLTLLIPAAASLKDKRQVVRKVLDRSRARFNASISEVEALDQWQRAVVGVACVANDHAFVQEQLDKIVNFMESLYVAEIINREVEIATYGALQGTR